MGVSSCLLLCSPTDESSSDEDDDEDDEEEEEESVSDILLWRCRIRGESCTNFDWICYLCALGRHFCFSPPSLNLLSFLLSLAESTSIDTCWLLRVVVLVGGFSNNKVAV